MDKLIFVVRLLLGGLLLAAGILKAHDGPAASVSTVVGYRILPQFAIAPLGVALPYLEIILGGSLVIGLFTRAVAWIASAQFLVFAIAVASLVIRQIQADCGCFGSSVATPPSWGHVAGDLLLALLAAGVARYAPGALALDRRMAGGVDPLGAEGIEV